MDESKRCPRCHGTGVLAGKRGPKGVNLTRLARLVAKGLTVVEIAERLGMTRQGVWHALKRMKEAENNSVMTYLAHRHTGET